MYKNEGAKGQVDTFIKASNIKNETNYPILIKLLQDIDSKINETEDTIVRADNTIEDIKTSLNRFKEEATEDLNNNFDIYKENTNILADEYQTDLIELKLEIDEFLKNKNNLQEEN